MWSLARFYLLFVFTFIIIIVTNLPSSWKFKNYIQISNVLKTTSLWTLIHVSPAPLYLLFPDLMIWVILDMLVFPVVCVNNHIAPPTHSPPLPSLLRASHKDTWITPGFSQLHAVRPNASSLGVANRKEGRHLRLRNSCVSSTDQSTASSRKLALW